MRRSATVGWLAQREEMLEAMYNSCAVYVR
jgi:hypothetical protein